MGKPFRSALLWHMERDGTSIAELAKGAGVSKDVIKKLRTGHSGSTDVEKAVAIAAFYGKSVEQFIRMEEPDEDGAMDVLATLLTPRERLVLKAQIQAILDTRDQAAS